MCGAAGDGTKAGIFILTSMLVIIKIINIILISMLIIIMINIIIIFSRECVEQLATAQRQESRLPSAFYCSAIVTKSTELYPKVLDVTQKYSRGPKVLNAKVTKLKVTKELTGIHKYPKVQNGTQMYAINCCGIYNYSKASESA